MADGDVIVPDSMPDVLKILQVDSEASVTDKYIENGKLTITGRCDYKVLYVPDSESEKIKCMHTSMEFRRTADAANVAEDSDIITKTTVERVEFNAVNSRKIRLRTVVHVDFEVSETKETEITIGAADNGVQTKISGIRFEKTVNISEHEFTVKEMLAIPNGRNSVGEILKSDVRICDTEYKSVSGKVIVKGILCICVLYTDTECETGFTEAEIPFTEVLDAEGVSENSVCDIDYCVINTMCRAEPDSDGELREIMLDIDISASLKACEREETDILTDCFMPGCETHTETKPITFRDVTERLSVSNTIRDTLEIPKNAPAIKSVYNIISNAEITKSQIERNRIICEGKAEICVLYLTDSAEAPICSVKKEIPFSNMTECETGADADFCDVKISVKHAGYNLNSDGNVEVRCVTVTECAPVREIKADNITEAESSPKDGRGGIVVYFASVGESLWDISKRYAVSMSDLAEYNDINGDVTECACRIFIPIR